MRKWPVKGDGQQSMLVLYMTGGCHLCEQAERVLRKQTGVTVKPVEIADDEELLERYGVRIPVLRRLDTGAELDWPFDADAVRRLLTTLEPL